MPTYDYRIEQLEKDAARYRWLKKKLIAADFNYNDSGESVLIFQWPKDCGVSGNCDAMIDAAMIVTSPPATAATSATGPATGSGTEQSG